MCFLVFTHWEICVHRLLYNHKQSAVIAIAGGRCPDQFITTRGYKLCLFHKNGCIVLAVNMRCIQDSKGRVDRGDKQLHIQSIIPRKG